MLHTLAFWVHSVNSQTDFKFNKNDKSEKTGV